MSVMGKLIVVPPPATAGATCTMEPDTRIQHAALCYRRNRRKIQVLLITSRDTNRWVLPKGWPMDGLDGARCAAQEAWEEAGVEGQIGTVPAGGFTYVKMLTPSLGVTCSVSVYPLRVRRMEHKFPERGERRRKWFNLRDAAARVAEPELRRLIAAFDPKAVVTALPDVVTALPDGVTALHDRAVSGPSCSDHDMPEPSVPVPSTPAPALTTPQACPPSGLPSGLPGPARVLPGTSPAPKVPPKAARKLEDRSSSLKSDGRKLAGTGKP